MPVNQSIAWPSRVSTRRQRFIRRSACTLPLKNAVRLAADVCFGFQCRRLQGTSLWSKTQRAWLGSKTFLDWAMRAEDIDILWTVATAVGAPQEVQPLRDAVREELAAYWAELMAALPRGTEPPWLPLP